ncbi:MPH1 [Candida pseudojiufengensis]|uniref:MPH1 n=1 Tax=Candida pseudojiufengensis TaxID=497109 RepID=UPI00222574F6|nr:MPH1 [Candida pseudojiufengensis]KAI5962093.1 MPH1 [Candida pseudojiufengensis]
MADINDESWDFSDDDKIIEAVVNNTKSSKPLTLKKYLQQQDNHATTKTSPSVSKITIPTHHEMDFNELKTYIYPTNFEVRDYQYNIVRKAFYDNLLVALPTGLGKTFIASTVMLNFLRWFPNSKIIFMAPTKPLVAQQIKACCSITGISSSKVAILLDKTRKNREEIWNSRQVFFTTPQVVENDLASGVVDPKSIVLLVIDEAHRARGNYSYNNVVTFLRRFNDSFRTLALTATPAADVEGVQDVIDNLKISKVEVRTEESIDIVKYMKKKKISRRVLEISPEIKECIDYLASAIEPVLKTANEKGLIDTQDPTKINHFRCMDAARKLTMNKSIPEGIKWANYFMLQLLGVVGQCYRRLNIYGVNSFFSYFTEKHSEFTTKWKKKKSKNKLSADFYFNDSIEKLLERKDEILSNGAYSHPKIEALMVELEDFFKDRVDPTSRVIIFTEYRESALEVVKSIEKVGGDLKPHIFIGQAKEKEKFDEENYGKKKGSKKKKDKDESRTSERTSSENAQVSGMNQKLQKEIIKKFKKGEYNILVATSIGEEGLDIGEVDLIICYDSTASPIKNIQRMGRTGRKRDGKVLLLFSSNEESKFDKAMAGYEYIQSHIMKGDLITLCQQNRIIPDHFSPAVVEKYIEIPEENIELKQEDDEDEIIRIATQYMLGSTPKKSNKRQPIQKRQKRFFMPDNVETGFQNVSDMLKKASPESSTDIENVSDMLKKTSPESSTSITKTARGHDLFDGSSDFDSDIDLTVENSFRKPIPPDNSKNLPIQKRQLIESSGDEDEIKRENTPETSVIHDVDADLKSNSSSHQPDTFEFSDDDLEILQVIETPNKKLDEKTKIKQPSIIKLEEKKKIKQPSTDTSLNEEPKIKKPKIEKLPTKNNLIEKHGSHNESKRKEPPLTVKNKSLGIKRPKNSDILSKLKQHSDKHVSKIRNISLGLQKPVPINTKQDAIEIEDDLDDDLDEVIAHYI